MPDRLSRQLNELEDLTFGTCLQEWGGQGATQGRNKFERERSELFVRRWLTGRPELRLSNGLWIRSTLATSRPKDPAAFLYAIGVGATLRTFIRITERLAPGQKFIPR